MRAVCTRSGRRGWVYAHTRGLCRSEGVELSVSLSLSPFFSTRRRKEYILARRSFIISAGRSFSTLRQSFFCLVSPPFFFFSNRPPSFLDRLPTGKGWKPRGRETAAPLPRFSARLVIISRYYPVCISLSFVAIALAARQINWNLSPIRVYMHVRVI